MEDVVQFSRNANQVLWLQIKTSSKNKKQSRKFLMFHHVSLICSIESSQINKVPTFHKLKIWMALQSSQTWTFLSIHWMNKSYQELIDHKHEIIMVKNKMRSSWKHRSCIRLRETSGTIRSIGSRRNAIVKVCLWSNSKTNLSMTLTDLSHFKRHN